MFFGIQYAFLKEATPRKTHRKAGGATINIPIQITFKNMLASEPIEANIGDRAEKLESFSDKIMGCRVLVEALQPPPSRRAALPRAH